MDGNLGYVGANILPYYDSLLVKVSFFFVQLLPFLFFNPPFPKVTASGATWETTLRRMKMALSEMRIKGVITNIPFLENVLGHPTFSLNGHVWTTFIDDTPSLFEFKKKRRNRKFKVINYLGDLAVNGLIFSFYLFIYLLFIHSFLFQDVKSSEQLMSPLIISPLPSQ